MDGLAKDKYLKKQMKKINHPESRVVSNKP